MKFDKLDNNNFLLFCIKHYDNPQCVSMEEFNEDLKRIKYIKKLVTRYIEGGELKERLILNHLIILSNIFGPTIICRILYFKMREQFKYIKPFLILLNIMPNFFMEDNKKIYSDDIPMDSNTVNILRKI